jgi:hypothetical protein
MILWREGRWGQAVMVGQVWKFVALKLPQITRPKRIKKSQGFPSWEWELYNKFSVGGRYLNWFLELRIYG